MASDTVTIDQSDHVGNDRDSAILLIKKINRDLKAAYSKAQSEGIALSGSHGDEDIIDISSIVQEARSIEISSEIFGLENQKRSMEDVLHNFDPDEYGDPFSSDSATISDPSPAQNKNEKNENEKGFEFKGDMILLSIDRSITEISNILSRMFIHMDNIETRLGQIENNFEKRYRTDASNVAEENFDSDIKKPRTARSRKTPDPR